MLFFSLECVYTFRSNDFIAANVFVVATFDCSFYFFFILRFCFVLYFIRIFFFCTAHFDVFSKCFACCVLSFVLIFVTFGPFISVNTNNFTECVFLLSSLLLPLLVHWLLCYCCVLFATPSAFFGIFVCSFIFK